MRPPSGLHGRARRHGAVREHPVRCVRVFSAVENCMEILEPLGVGFLTEDLPFAAFLFSAWQTSTIFSRDRVVARAA